MTKPELLKYGLEVFNNEEVKFKRWLKKTNYSLGGKSPESLLESVEGTKQVEYALNRINYGNFS